jgi:hypothetical protein
MGKSTATTDVPHYVRSLALGVPAILLGIQLSGWIGFIPVVTDGHFDFRQLYTAGYMVRSGHASELYVYDAQKAFQDTLISREQIALPFNHLAYEALLYAPFSLLFMAEGVLCIPRPAAGASGNIVSVPPPAYGQRSRSLSLASPGNVSGFSSSRSHAYAGSGFNRPVDPSFWRYGFA